MRAWIVAGALAAAAMGPSRAVGEEGAPSPEAERRRLEEEIARELGGGARVSKEGAPPASGPAPSAPSGQNPYARLLALPDLSAVVSFGADWSGPDGRPAFRFDELELGLQSVIDPYARADVFLAFGSGDAAVEEAYLTTLSLPAGMQVKAGRLFSPWGRINGQHPHAQEFVDGPIALGRLVAEEVLAGPGVDASWLAPLPWFAELHLAVQGTAPAEGDEERLTGIVRLAQLFPLGDGTTLGVGLSAGRRGEGAGAFRDLGGADLLLRWRRAASREALTLQAELFGRRLAGADEWGGYAQLFWRAAPRWGAGVRYDQAPAGGASPGAERRLSALGTWYLSEFQRLRVQVTRDEKPGTDGWEALLRAEFGIGAHGAHPF